MKYRAPRPVLQVRPALVVACSKLLTPLQKPSEADLGLQSAFRRWKLFFVATHGAALDYRINGVWCMPCTTGFCRFDVRADAEQHIQATETPI